MVLCCLIFKLLYQMMHSKIKKKKKHIKQKTFPNLVVSFPLGPPPCSPQETQGAPCLAAPGAEDRAAGAAGAEDGGEVSAQGEGEEEEGEDAPVKSQRIYFTVFFWICLVKGRKKTVEGKGKRVCFLFFGEEEGVV